MDQHGVLALYKSIAASSDDYEKAEECLDVTYYSTKKPTDYLMLLQLSNSLRIMNISSILGKVQIQAEGMIEISPYRRMIRDTIDEKDLNRHNFAVAMEEVDLKTVSRWDRMNIDLLVKIFKQMNMLELLPISLVCRGWRHGCSDAWLWDTLDLGLLQSNFIPTRASPFVFVDEPSDRKLTRVLKLAFSLSQGNIRCLVFHYYLYMKDEHLNLIVERCPNLKRIVIPAWNRLSKPAIYRAIETWQGLESMTMPWCPNPSTLMEKIGANCKNFTQLIIFGAFDMNLAVAITTFLPNLKVLSLRCSRVDKKALLFFLKSMGGLEVLNISHIILLVEGPADGGLKAMFKEIDPAICENTASLRKLYFCSSKSCVCCQRMINDEGLMRWWKYEDWFWRIDEVSSLALGDTGKLFDAHCAEFAFLDRP
ncbi:RNI-like protein [Dioscorea alata]|uniref:RNI-like protein n=1 Tax=Dioscorea alata TaxID=55571 RepID=A0ACB7UQR6_DIOAL|nr:RNI-like protein [Dioscorea alata]